MISMIQLKQVLRNRRFVLFTILLPLAWYMFLYNIQADMLPNIMLGLPCLSVSSETVWQPLVKESPLTSVFIPLNPDFPTTA